jgi:predicted heme/steroid binding protein
MKEFDLESLSKFNGNEGQPSYIAYKGKVFDVSESKLWNTGLHMKHHPAGHDLTADIEAAPHGPEKMDLYPQVGTMKVKAMADGILPKHLEVLLERFPFLRRHPHPMLVHFPIAFTVSPALFYLLYLITNVNAFYMTAYYLPGGRYLLFRSGHPDRFFHLVDQLSSQTFAAGSNQDHLFNPARDVSSPD